MKYIMGALLLLFGTQASAAVLRCDGCSESGYRSKSIAAGPGVHYVYDLASAQARKYETSLQCDDNLTDGRTVCSREATPLPVEQEVGDFVLELAAYHRVTNGTMKAVFTFNASGAVEHLSAFDVAGPGGPREALIDWFNSTQLLSLQNALPLVGTAAHNLAVTIASMWNDSLGQTHAIIQFRDGSRITLTYELINNSVTVLSGTAKDRYGNIIPGNPEEADGLRFDYSAEGENGAAQQRMRDYLQSIGIEVPVTSRRWVCVQIGESQWQCGYY